MDGQSLNQPANVGLQGGAANFQAAVFDRVAASATLRRSRQPSRLPEDLQSRHRAFSILQSLVGVILALLGFVALAWSSRPVSPLGTAVGVWAGPAFLLAGQFGCQAGRSGNGGRSRRAALSWSTTSLAACLASFCVGLAAIVLRARRIDLPPAPVAVADCVNLVLICFGLCMSAAQSAFAYLSVWHCYWASDAPKAAATQAGIYTVQKPGQFHFQQEPRDVQLANNCMKQRGSLTEELGKFQPRREKEHGGTPPPTYLEWRSLTLGPEADPASPGSPECRSMVLCGEKQQRRKKNLRVHWEP